jgi:hypothetical protein
MTKSPQYCGRTDWGYAGMLSGNWITAACLVVLLLPSAGCQTSDNPAEGGIVGGLHGLLSGSYDQRLQARQTELGGAQLQGQYLATDNARLENRVGDAASERARLRRQLVALQARARELTAETNRIQGDTKSRREQRADLERKLQKLRTEIDQLGRDVDASRKSAEAVERERQALEAELKDLTVVANGLQ